MKTEFVDVNDFHQELTLVDTADNIFGWNEENTFQFIHLRAKYCRCFTGKRNSSRFGWRRVVADMGIEDRVTIKQCRRKWENLMRKYKELRDSRTGSEEDVPISWPYYEAMDAIVKNKQFPFSVPSIRQESTLPSQSNELLSDTSCQPNNNNTTTVLASPSPSTSDSQSDDQAPPKKRRKSSSSDLQELKSLMVSTLQELKEQGDEIRATNTALLNMLKEFMKK